MMDVREAVEVLENLGSASDPVFFAGVETTPTDLSYTEHADKDCRELRIRYAVDAGRWVEGTLSGMVQERLRYQLGLKPLPQHRPKARTPKREPVARAEGGTVNHPELSLLGRHQPTDDELFILETHDVTDHRCACGGRRFKVAVCRAEDGAPSFAASYLICAADGCGNRYLMRAEPKVKREKRRR